MLNTDRLLPAVLFLAALAPAALGWSVSSGPQEPIPPARTIRQALMNRVNANIDATAKDLDARISPASIREWQAVNRAALLSAVGPLPDPQARPRLTVLERFKRETFSFEKVLIESRPRHHVTGILFLPDPNKFAAPRPAVAVACGHTTEGKGYPMYLQAAANLAHNGIVALLYDPLEQGERMQDIDKNGGYSRHGTRGHNVVGTKAVLLGWTMAGLEAWDGMQVISALQARPEVDPERIGCMGNSGGGTQSSQLLALDNRIKAAAPGCYITSYPILIEAIGPQDAEQNIHGQLKRGLDHDAYLTLRAPTPVLVCARTGDFFPIAGTRHAVKKATRVFERLGAADAIGITESAGGHGWNAEGLEDTVQWMCRWLDGRDGDIKFRELDIPDQKGALVTTGGQILLRKNERSIHQIMGDEVNRLRTGRRDIAHARKMELARERIGLPSLEEIPIPRIQVFKDEHGNEQTDLLRLHFPQDVQLDARLVRSKTRNVDTVVVLHSEGAMKSTSPKKLEQLLASHGTVILLDIAGTGTAANTGEGIFYGRFGAEAKDAVILDLLGESLVGYQAQQILGAIRALGGNQPVDLDVTGRVGVAAHHAAGLEPGLFRGVRIQGCISSWEELMQRHDIELYFSHVVLNALKEYDLPDLARVFNGAAR